MSSWPPICGPPIFLHAINIANITLCIIYLIVYGIAGYNGCARLYRDENRKRIIPKKYRCIFVISLISGVLSSIAYLLTIISCYSGSPFVGLIFTIFTSIPYHVLWVAIWFNLLLRLEGAFQDSAYALNEKLMICFKAIGVIMFLLGMTQLVIWISGMNTVHFGNYAQGNELSAYDEWLLTHRHGAMTMIVLAETSIFIVFGLTFDAVFIARILRLTKFQISTAGTNAVSLDLKQIRFIRVVSRTVVLSFFAILTTFCIFLTIAYRGSHEGQEQYTYPITTLLQLLDMAMNFMCIHLNYAFAQEQYQSVCGCCDRGVMQLIESRLRVYSETKLHATLNHVGSAELSVDSSPQSLDRADVAV
mmetsp:Transcript_39666/g.63463  ORF Transcript_39666/g.63463 Transcript_39666/m.63463 type:complete len:361 (+) Transcript_39666:61-1143(+)